METVDRARICRSIYPSLLSEANGDNGQTWNERDTDNVIAAAAEGYAFPTNLDFDQPVGGLAPPSQSKVLSDAIAARVPLETFLKSLEDHTSRRKSH